MKKYLMKSGMVALAMAFVVSSCSKYDNVYDPSASKAQAQYEAAFINHFGQPDPNQDWGFGTTAAAPAFFKLSNVSSPCSVSTR